MLTGFGAKKVIVSAGDAAIRPQAPVNVVTRWGIAELIDVAITGVYPSTTEAHQTGRRFLI